MRTEGSSPPRVVATIGMHGSASTWVFNVVRELMIAAMGDIQVVSLYADQREQLPDVAGRCLVIKSHHGSVGLDSWLVEAGARIFLSVRDPRDACVSMCQRFQSPLAHCAQWIGNDCNRLLRLAPQGYPLLRYEDRFFDDKDMVKRIAVSLTLQPPPETIDTIFDRYRTEAVRTFAESLGRLPPERLTTVVRFPMDKVTQILGPHIGDTLSGKWRDLPAHVQAELTRVFRPFLDRFGYPC
jgi:hypothetical protein